MLEEAWVRGACKLVEGDGLRETSFWAINGE
jgi:hypothetical protein